MQKKVFIIILPIAFFIFYGCSSMKHSTIVLYVSHKVEGPLYMPQQEPPVSAQAPQTNTVNQSSQERRHARFFIESKTPSAFSLSTRIISISFSGTISIPKNFASPSFAVPLAAIIVPP